MRVKQGPGTEQGSTAVSPGHGKEGVKCSPHSHLLSIGDFGM